MTTADTKERIKKVILKYRQLAPTQLFPRDLELHESGFDKADVIVGPRKAGKSTYLFQHIKKHPEREWVLINFEDNLLGEIKQNELQDIVDCAKELYPGKKLTFFFDEIQVVQGWERFIISILNEHHRIIVTGSNSRLLSKEIATSLRGKSLSWLLLPFSFKEYLRVNGVAVKPGYEYTDKTFEIKKRFSEYFACGGFPEIVLSNSELIRNKLFNNYFDSVLYSDLAERLKLKNVRLITITIKYLLNRFSNTFSITTFENYLKSNKIPYSLEDIYLILKSLEDVFLAGYVREYLKSYKKTEVSKAKVYLFDVGYIHYLALESDDRGRILENIVFVELFRRSDKVENDSIYYCKSERGAECDFIVLDKGKPSQAIQVTLILNPANQEREITGLLETMKKFNFQEGIILTWDQNEELTMEGKKIHVLPVWKWLLA